MKDHNSTNKTPFIIGALILVILVVVGVVLASQDKSQESSPQSTSTPESQESTSTPEGEAEEPDSETGTSSEEQLEDISEDQVEMEEENTEALDNAEEEVEGASKVSEEGQVLTDSGEEASNNATPGTEDAPEQTQPLEEGDLSEGTIQLGVSEGNGFEPSEFTVGIGDPTTVSVTSQDDDVHVFKFRDDSLEGVAVGVSSGETRAITFNAPEEPGEYDFYCDVPGHPSRGEEGTMIVQ